MTSPALTNNIALHGMATHELSQHEAEDGALTTAQLEQIKQQAPQGTKRSVRSSFFELKTAQGKR